MSERDKNILVVDDSEIIRKFIRTLLETENYRVFEAADGEEATEIYKSSAEEIDLIITDIYMPKKTGIELMVELMRDKKDMKIIVFSNGGKYNFSNELGECEALGATYFIKKDSIKSELVDLVKKIFSE